MRKTIKSPTPQLSILKEINIDLDMTGRHYALLASCEGQLPEDVVLSILKDLVEEDANKLTLSELRYLFMLVKINSLENKYVISVECTHITRWLRYPGKSPDTQYALFTVRTTRVSNPVCYPHFRA